MAKYQPEGGPARIANLEIPGFPQFFPQVWKTLGGTPNLRQSVRARIRVRQTGDCSTRTRPEPAIAVRFRASELTGRRAVRYHWWFDWPASGKTCHRPATSRPARRSRTAREEILSDEAYVSAQEPPAAPDPWFPRAHAHEERPHRVEAPSRKGSQASDGLVELTWNIPRPGQNPGGPSRLRRFNGGSPISWRPAHQAPKRLPARL